MSDNSIKKYDVAVLGGGPGGYTAAIRAAQLGANVALVEENILGGTCTNVGCIPTKTLLGFVKILSEIKRAELAGLEIGTVKVNLAKLMRSKEEIIDNLAKGIELLLKNNNVETVYGRGTLTEDKEINVIDKLGNKRIVRASKIIIATGSKPAKPPIQGLDGKKIIFDEDASDFNQIPPKLAIVGGGPEGVEFAYIYSKLGSEVIILEMLPNILPREDLEIAKRLRQRMLKDGIKIETNSKVIRIEDEAENKMIIFENKDQEKKLRVDRVLVMFGRRPNIDDLGLDEIGIKTTEEGIEVNDKMMTNIPNIFAIGDVTGGAYAHEAMEEGMIAAENSMDSEKNSSMDSRVIPRCFFTIPQVAAVGLTEHEAKGKGYDVKIGKFYFGANPAAMAIGETDGFVKFVMDGRSKEILGIHILGHNASELIAEASLAMKLKIPIEEIFKTIHAHPTLSEAVKEAAMDLYGMSIHKSRRIS
ncbi:MAG: dihydrolipoyl dehydrogenase [Candidatus Bathyarchaeota archaeon]|nr:dihydrolipoyl dehydrogenase [Candidatus Bathyarchaeota archaeon]